MSWAMYAQSCTGAMSMTIPGSGTAMPMAILGSSTVQNLTCSGVPDGAITVNMAGGTTPYTYLWSDNPTINSGNRTGLAAGNYTVWVADGNNCTQQQTFTVTSNAISLTTSSNTPICTGSALSLMSSSTGAGPGTYLWAGPGGSTYNTQNANIPSATLSQSGTWNLTWTSSVNPACQATQSVNVFVGPIALTITPDLIDSTVVHAQISNCAPPYTLYWRRIVTGSSWSNQNSPTNNSNITGLLPSTAYMAYAVDANGATTELVYFTTGGIPYCGPAPVLNSFVNCDKIFLDWSGGPLYTQYATYIRKITPVLGATSGSYTAATSKVFTITPANFNSTYEVSVFGMCDNQYSLAAAPSYVTVPDPRPGAPTGLSFSATCNSITTTWQAVPNAVGYFVRMKNPLSNSTFVNFYTTNTSYTKTGIAANFTYEVWVIPVGCGSLAGTPSQHFYVMSCSGVITPIIRSQNPDLEAQDLNEAILENLPEANLQVYPNPNNGHFTVSIEGIKGEITLLEVLNTLGQTVYSAEVKPDNGDIKHEIALDNQNAAGTYLVKISTPFETYFRKVIKF